jgi:cell division protein FtsL
MSLEKRKRQVDDAEVEAALRHFKASVHDWSDREFARTRPLIATAPVGFWSWMRSPFVGWALGCAVLLAAVGVPVTVHHERVVVAEHDAVVREQARLDAEAATSRAIENEAASVSDEYLLTHVDSDISQATPDAMQPLAELMNETDKN